MCFVLHIAKENKLRGNINVERSSNVITFSATECMCLQSCLYSFSISSYISEEEICSVFLVISPGKFPNTYRWTFLHCIATQLQVFYVLLSKPVAKLQYHNSHYSNYSTHMLLTNKTQSAAVTISAKKCQSSSERRLFCGAVKRDVVNSQFMSQFNDS